MFKIILAPSFKKDAKPLLKRYPSIANELARLGQMLEEEPTTGLPLGKSCYKIRLAIKSKGKGKSGGAKVITYVVTENDEVILLAIYDKNEKSDLRPNELDSLLEDFL